MRNTFLFLLLLLISGCSESKIERYTAADGSGESILYDKEAKKEIAVIKNESNVEESTPLDGKALYKKRCSLCHGDNAEKSALNSSNIIAGYEKEKVLRLLKGYKEGSYGGTMSAVMKGQVSTISEAEKEKIAEYIATLK